MTQERKRNYRRKQTDNITAAATEMGNVPPQATDVEDAVLGAMMVSTDSVDQVMDLLTPQSFYDFKNRSIFEAMLDLFNERSPIDMLTVVEKMRQKGTLEEVGGPARLASLTQKVGTGANIEYYVRILQQKTIQRNLIEASYGILKDAFDSSVTVDDLVSNAQDSVYNAIAGNLKNPYKHVSEVINASMERIERVQNSTGVTGVHSGFHKLDHFTMGWQPGNLIILGARPSVGKTAFALNLARNAAVEFGEAVAFFSLEMTSMELTDRLIATESGITSDKLKGKLKMLPEEWQILEQSIARIVKAPIYIDETPGITLTEFTAKAKRLVREKGVRIIFVDYLQLMHSGKPQVGGFSKVQEVTDISNTLKTTAKELGIPIIALAQLNRNLMSRMGSNGKPVLSDLKDSGSIEQDADIVMFIHRPGLLGLSEDLDEQAKTEVIIAKNRNGQVGSVDMRYVGHLMKFEDVQTTFYESAMNSDPGRTPARKDVAYQPQVVQQPYNPFDEFAQTDFNI
ncbi:MAG: replicative DNA helicase [Bacteroidales bacterium]|nr:replicative DNA helicase [Bacteroidales bacterium]